MKAVAVALMLMWFGTAAAAAPDGADFAWVQRQGQEVPQGLMFTDADGHTAPLGTWLGNVPTVLALGYFQCPNLCGIIRDDAYSALSRTNLVAGRDYRLLVVSIDPAESSADAKSAREAALTRYDPPPGGWRFLTGKAAALEQAVGFRARFDPQLKQFLHPSGLVFLTSSGTVSSYLLGVGYSPGDVQAAVARAERGAMAKALPVLLLCFHYDPATGRYTLAIEKVLQVAAALTVLTLGGLIVLLRRSERR